ncbi:MAG: 2-amino-4-hydroxy-6-hydroxymethyldihydropteridine diphosphokinase [Acidimicrobiia bacterium]
MTRFAIGLGSNMGDRLEYLRNAVTEMEEIGTVVAVSGLYESEPVGGPEQDPYLNAILVLETDLDAESLLGRLQQVESASGRERTVRWGPRTLDLDLITGDGVTVDSPTLTLPHPRSADRRFVLEPLAEVWPQAIVSGSVVAEEALTTVGDQRVDLLARRWGRGLREQGPYWVLGQFLLVALIAGAMAFDGSLPESPPGPFRVLGGVIIVIGVILAFASTRRLGKALTALPEPVANAQLVEKGTYAHARHPIYGGVTLVMLGTSLLLDSIWALVLTLGLLLFFWSKSSYEERRLRIAYPGYGAYRDRVPRRLIPFVL